MSNEDGAAIIANRGSAPQRRATWKLVKRRRCRAPVGSPDTNTTKGKRDRAILAVLLGGGLRRSEAAQTECGTPAKERGSMGHCRSRG